MSSQHIQLNAETRTAGSKGKPGRMRRAGMLPGVIYGKGKTGRMVSVNEHEFTNQLKGHPSENLMLDLNLDGKVLTVLLREVQQNAITGKVLHLDFNEVAKDQKIRVHVAVELHGEAAGVKAGGTLETLLSQVEVECLPDDLVEVIVFDVSAMQVGDHASVEDLQIDREKIHILTAPEVGIASIAAPRVSSKDDEEDADASEEAAEA